MKYNARIVICRVKRSRSLIFIISVFLFSLQSCKNDVGEKQIRSLDSLSGALNQKLTELKQADTIVLSKAITKYNNYRHFIQQNLTDTVSKQEADQLQQFYNSGKILVSFSDNRKAILARGNLVNSQLSKLITDARSKVTDEGTLMKYFAQEKTNAEDVIRMSHDQQKFFVESLQEFKLSLSGIEALIKSRNNGQMPTIIKDSIPL